MTRSRSTIVLALVLWAGVAALATWIPAAYLSEYSGRQVFLPLPGLVWLLGAALVYATARRRALAARERRVFAGAAVLVTAMLALSWLFPRITHASFGLTFVGLVPVPVFDLTVGPSGTLGFRDKTHRVTRAEVESLLGPRVRSSSPTPPVDEPVARLARPPV